MDDSITVWFWVQKHKNSGSCGIFIREFVGCFWEAVRIWLLPLLLAICFLASAGSCENPPTRECREKRKRPFSKLTAITKNAIFRQCWENRKTQPSRQCQLLRARGSVWPPSRDRKPHALQMPTPWRKHPHPAKRSLRLARAGRNEARIFIASSPLRPFSKILRKASRIN